jgi:heme/copper-type cytochrome/quinol oxidase subunit 2
MKRFLPTLLLALPFLVAMVPAVAHSTRTIDVMLSRCAVSPEQIEVRLGERVRLNVTSMDGTPGFEVKELRLNAQLPAGGKTVMLDLVPTEAGAFEIQSSNECGSDHNRMRARLVVTPEQ